MKVAVFSTHSYEKTFLEKANIETKHELIFLEPRLQASTIKLADDFPAVCAFATDDLSAPVLQQLAKVGVKVVALRSAGFNHVDLAAAKEFGLRVVRVPRYSPHAVAEHAIALILALDRKLIRAHSRVQECNFSLDGLMGFDLIGKTAAVIGTGAIGSVVAKLLAAFGCQVLAFDPVKNSDCEKAGIKYVSLDEMFSSSDIITLHCPLTESNHHLVDQIAVEKMKTGVMLINTSRGGLIDTKAIIKGLKSQKIGYLGLDVYEEETELFFHDCSNQVLEDDVFARLLTFPNVLITGHQAFFTKEALEKIAEITLQNISDFEAGRFLKNEVLNPS